MGMGERLARVQAYLHRRRGLATQQRGNHGDSAELHRTVRTRSRAYLATIDALLVALAYRVAIDLRFDLDVPAKYQQAFHVYLPLAMVGHLVANRALGLYNELWKQASIKEARRVVVASVLAAVGIYAATVPWLDNIPLSLRIIGPTIATLYIGLFRFRSRLFTLPAGKDTSRTRVLLIGAGEAGGAVVREAGRNANWGIVPVGVLDDDPRKRKMSLAGVPVVGRVDDLPEACSKLGVRQVLLAIPSANATLVRRIARLCDMADVTLRVVPRVRDLIGGRVSMRDIRDLELEDLVGRSEVQTDFDAVRELLRGKRVLITGAGGSIGSEIARQVAEFHPANLLLLDRDETHLHDLMAGLSYPAHALLADIRDRDRLRTLFSQWRPQVVFHAAAHKHVPLLEEHPSEAFLSNVLGTRNVVEASSEVGVGHFVLISTDKAIRPRSVMGASKRLAELVVLSRIPDGMAYCAVRFGNVLGSRGSVVPTFARQIDAGGPVTVTDPAMTRFFISTPEAVQLVLQATVFSTGGEIFMLDMGDPVNILDLAKRMIRLAGRVPDVDVPIAITGSRAGEKLMEDLWAPGEERTPTDHASIFGVRTERMPRQLLDLVMGQLEAAVWRNDEAEIVSTLLGMANQENALVV